MQAVILAAGKGTRMRSDVSKVLHEILGTPVLGHVLNVLSDLGVKKPKVVIGNQADRIRSFLKEFKTHSGISSDVVLQKEQKGTGHAVLMAKRSLASYSGDVLIWPGDMPLLKRSTLEAFKKQHQKSGADVSVLSSIQINPTGYGRILRSGGRFYGIREEVDATDSEKRIQEVNAGIYLYKTKALFEALKKIKPLNRKGEYYLTDTIEVLDRAHKKVAAFPLALPEEGIGINSRFDLAKAIEIMKNREIHRHMSQGVTFEAPDQTFVAPNVKIGQDTVIYPWSYIQEGVKIGKNCSIGPFAKINKGCTVEDGSVVGSYVELTRSKLGKKVVAKHLAYIGDAAIQDGTNVGAGTITANFDGKNKSKTKIGKKVLVGSNTVFVAPVQIGDQARTGAGSVVVAGSRVKKGEVVAGVPAKPLKGKKRKK